MGYDHVPDSTVCAAAVAFIVIGWGALSRGNGAVVLSNPDGYGDHEGILDCDVASVVRQTGDVEQ